MKILARLLQFKVLMLMVATALIGCEKPSEPRTAYFQWFEYEGNDAFDPENITNSNQNAGLAAFRMKNTTILWV